MRRRVLFFNLLLQVALADDLPPVSAYVGENVTLRSGADSSWELSQITWSIWANTTWIATYYSNTINVNHFYRYQNRLHLNTSTGDLVIERLKSEDKMEYTVDFFNTQRQNKVNKIKLNIKQPLKDPTIQTWLGPADSCVVGLRCSSPDSGVALSWQTEPHFQRHSESGDVLMGFLNKTQSSIKFTCVSSKNGDNASASVSLKCEDLPPPVTSSAPTTPDSDCRVISRDPVFFVYGFFVGAAVVCCIVYYIKQRRKSGSRNISDI